MINFISLSNAATYVNEPQVMRDLSQFNFIFGSNGSGKTTITRVIKSGSDKYPDCEIRWKDKTPMQTLVYNQDFIKSNFNELTEFKGVFTLGEKQVETLRNIKDIKSDIDKIQNQINSLTKKLQGEDGEDGKTHELDKLTNQLVDKCWKQKQKYDDTLKDGFEGYRNSKQKFKDKVLEEWQRNQAQLCDFEDLKNRTSLVFSKKLTPEEPVPEINLSSLVNHESNPILIKSIIGKEDVDIAAMIKTLDNSDWVRQGKEYFEANDSICPFCQQNTDESFSKSLEEYFDETFTADINKIEDLINQYATSAIKIQEKLNNILSDNSKFLDIGKLSEIKKDIDSKIATNRRYLEEKKAEATRSIKLESLQDIDNKITNLIEAANNKINNRNRIIDNITNERKTLTSEIWKFIIEELDNDLKTYKKEKDNLETAIDNLKSKIKEKETEKSNRNNELRELEKQRTSIEPTIDAINALLKSFGFINFSLTKASEISYKLVRPNGEDAITTLSEGEKTFITFLYFYHLLKGSISESGMITDRVVVIDDPVSSLDADILFIVSSLIKELFEKMHKNESYIKQIFILTHNVYFHKEVTLNLQRVALKSTTFWVIHKFNNGPKIEKHTSNPIQTSYELLWSEVKNADHSKLTIQNTLRRILEHHFKILGGINPNEICSMFDGSDRFICQSLFSWLNDGSHSIHDDINIAIDNSTVERNLKIFKEIFQRSGHIAHYNMMMDIRTY